MAKNKIRFICISVLIICLATCFACGKENEQEQRSQTTEENKTSKVVQTKDQKITIAQFGHLLVYLPIYVAKEKGFFKDQGLEVTYVSTGGDEKTFAAVISGSAQFGVADPTFVAIAREKGNDQGQIIASVIDGVPFWGVSKKDIKIEKIEDFANLKVATYPAPSTNYSLMEKMIKANNLNTKIIQGAFGTLLSILQNNRADIAMILEPTASLAVKEGYHVVFSYKDFYGDFALTGLSTTRSFIKENPEICQKVVNALQMAYKYAYTDFEGTVEVAKRQFPDFDDFVVRQGVKRMIVDETIPKGTILKEKSWQEAIALRKYIGDLQSDAPFAKNVNNSFADTAVTTVGAVQ